MSGYSENNNRINKLFEFSKNLIYGQVNSTIIKENKKIIDSIKPIDVIIVVDKLVSENISEEVLKPGVNKLINLFYKSLNGYAFQLPEMNSFLDCLIQDNKQLSKRLDLLKAIIKKINKNPEDKIIQDQLIISFREIELFKKHYQIKENILFPVLEKYWNDYRCIQLMWSYHDDIRRNISSILNTLENEEFDIKTFNKLTGRVFFDMYSIIFREEKILFPVILETISDNDLQSMLFESIEIGFPFIEPDNIKIKESNNQINNTHDIDLKTGYVSPEQISLIFNHLPVDVTYVDENNKVKYYSTPKKRIFIRTNSVLGRDVENCHPPESVQVVYKIIEAFRKGDKDNASFWIKMKDELILIQYFAVRNKLGEYKGVVEVSQEINNIKNIEGEKRLLDWKE